MEQLLIIAQATNITLTFRLINQDPNWQQTVRQMPMEKKVDPNYDVLDTTCCSSFTKTVIWDSQVGK